MIGPVLLALAWLISFVVVIVIGLLEIRKGASPRTLEDELDELVMHFDGGWRNGSC